MMILEKIFVIHMLKSMLCCGRISIQGAARAGPTGPPTSAGRAWKVGGPHTFQK